MPRPNTRVVISRPDMGDLYIEHADIEAVPCGGTANGLEYRIRPRTEPRTYLTAKNAPKEN